MTPQSQYSPCHCSITSFAGTRSVAVLFMLALSAFSLIACATSKPLMPPYQMSFAYPMPTGATKIDVTVGVVAPQWSGEATNGTKPKALVSALRTSFNELLTAKGFNTAGPFDSVENMTFPEKKGVDFVLYPDIDFIIDHRRSAPNLSVNVLTGTSVRCTITIVASGNVQILVKEPLSGEKMWIKRLPVSITPTDVPVSGSLCGHHEPPSDKEVAALDEAWGRATVDVYTQIMSALDKHVNGEEFLRRRSPHRPRHRLRDAEDGRMRLRVASCNATFESQFA